MGAIIREKPLFIIGQTINRKLRGYERILRSRCLGITYLCVLTVMPAIL